MGATATWFAKGLMAQFAGVSGERVDWVADTIKAAIVDSTAPIDQATNNYWSDLSAHEVSGAGYTAGGFTLASKTLTYDTPTRTLRLRAADVVVDPITYTNGRFAVIYKSTGVAGTSILLGSLDFGATISPSADPFAIYWDAVDGALRHVLAPA